MTDERIPKWAKIVLGTVMGLGFVANLPFMISDGKYLDALLVLLIFGFWFEWLRRA